MNRPYDRWRARTYYDVTVKSADDVSHLSAFTSNDRGYAVVVTLTVSLLAVLKIGGWI